MSTSAIYSPQNIAQESGNLASAKTDLDTADVDLTAEIAELAGTPVGGTAFNFTTGATDISDTGVYALAAAGAAGVKNYLQKLHITCSASGGYLKVLDGATVIWIIHLAANGIYTYDSGFGGPMGPTTAATALNVQATAGTWQVNAKGYAK